MNQTAADVEARTAAQTTSAIKEDAVRVFDDQQLAHIPERRAPQLAYVMHLEGNRADIGVGGCAIAPHERRAVERAIRPAIVGHRQLAYACVESAGDVFAFAIVIGDRFGVVIRPAFALAARFADEREAESAAAAFGYRAIRDAVIMLVGDD